MITADLPRIQTGKLIGLSGTSIQLASRAIRSIEHGVEFDPDNFIKTNGGGGQIILIPIPSDHPKLRVKRKGARCGVVLAHKDGDLKKGDIVFHTEDDPCSVEVEGYTVHMVYNHNAEVGMTSSDSGSDNGCGKEVVIPISQISSFAGKVINAFR